MRISDRYIGKQVLWGTLYAVLVLGLVLVLGNLFKKIQPLLVDQKAPLVLVIRFVINVLPLSLMYTIPWGFLSAVLLVFRRMSSHHEITSFRVAGLSLVRLAAPVFVIGVGLSVLSLWLNLNVVPHARATIWEVLYDQAKRDPGSLLKPGVVQGDFKGDGVELQKLLIEGKSGEWVEGFHCYILPKERDGTGDVTYVHAARAALSLPPGENKLMVKLQDAYFETRDAKGEMQIWFAQEAEPLIFDLKDPRRPSPKSMTNAEIREQLAADPTIKESKRLKMHLEMESRYSFSMACLAFAFVAVPLGLQSRRRETSGGLLLSLLIGTGYFLVTMLAQEFEAPSVALLVLWSPNVVCVLLGLYLFWRVRFK